MQRVELDERSQFRLVLEVEAWSDCQRTSADFDPSVSRHQSPAGDVEPAQAQHAPVHPVGKGSRFVLSDAVLDHPLLLQLVLQTLEGSGLPGFPDEDGTEDGEVDECVEPMGGGIAILDHDRVLIEPSCCGDLANLNRWDDLVESGFGKGKLWIGHPELEFEARRGVLLLRQTGSSRPTPQSLLEVFVDLRRAHEEMGRVREERDRLESVLQALLNTSPQTAHLGDLAPYLVGKRD